MSRYINENTRRVPGVPKNVWWKNFDVKVHTFYFLFITSFLKGNFKSQLEYISKSQSDIQGGAVSVDNLLYIAEKLKSGVMQYEEFFLEGMISSEGSECERYTKIYTELSIGKSVCTDEE